MWGFASSIVIAAAIVSAVWLFTQEESIFGWDWPQPEHRYSFEEGEIEGTVIRMDHVSGTAVLCVLKGEYGLEGPTRPMVFDCGPRR